MRWTKLIVFGLILALMPSLAVAQSLGELVQQGNAAQKAGNYAEAERIWQRIIQSDPEDANAYNNLGNALYDQGKLEEAIAAYRQAIALDPKSTYAYYNLGTALYHQGKREEAIAAYRQAIALDPKLALAYNNLGIALDDQGKREEAIAAYRQAIALDPKLALAYNNLGIALDDQGKREEAIAAYDQALSLPDDTSGTPTTAHTAAHNNLGLLLQEQGKLAEAISEFEKATQIDPNYDFAQNNLKEARRQLALQEQPAQLIALNETKYLPTNDDLTPIKRSIVKIKVVFSGNAKGTAYGTGYVIKRQGNKVLIVTNRHVVIDRDTGQAGSDLEIEPYYGENLPPTLPRARSPAKIVNTTPANDKLDVALLEVTGFPADIQPLTIDLNPIRSGTKIIIIGHPADQDWSEYDATLSGIQESSGNLLIDVTLAVGSSGSPVLDPNRRVIGIMFKTVNGSLANAIGIAHPIALVKQQLAQWGVTIP